MWAEATEGCEGELVRALTSRCSASSRLRARLRPKTPAILAASAKSRLYLYEAYTCGSIGSSAAAWRGSPSFAARLQPGEPSHTRATEVMRAGVCTTRLHGVEGPGVLLEAALAPWNLSPDHRLVIDREPHRACISTASDTHASHWLFWPWIDCSGVMLWKPVNAAQVCP